MANIKTTPAEWATARAMYGEGYRFPQISRAMGASESSLSKKAKKENWTRGGFAKRPPDDVPAGTLHTDPPIIDPPPGRCEETAKQVEALAGLGLIDEEIAEVVGVRLPYLREHYARELVTASPRLVAKVAQSLYRMATDAAKPSSTAAMYWLDRRGGPGWADKKIGVDGKKGERQRAAEAAATGKYAAAAPPKLKLVG